MSICSGKSNKLEAIPAAVADQYLPRDDLTVTGEEIELLSELTVYNEIICLRLIMSREVLFL
jgi:hypothetical protein